MKTAKLALLLSLVILTNLITTIPVRAQLMLVGQQISVERRDSSETRFGDLAYVRYDFTLIATSDRDIYVSGLIYSSPVANPTASSASAGKNTWTHNQNSGYGYLNMVAETMYGTGPSSQYDILSHTFRINTGEEIRLSMDFLFTTPVSDFVRAGITGIAYGYSPGIIDQYLSGETVSPLDTGGFFLRGTPEVPEPTGSLILLVAVGLLITYRSFMPA